VGTSAGAYAGSTLTSGHFSRLLGWPILFWQKRIGYQGRPFLIYKFRTLHPPFDRNGNFVDESRRVSRLGAFLRRTRLDETPQL